MYLKNKYLITLFTVFFICRAIFPQDETETDIEDYLQLTEEERTEPAGLEEFAGNIDELKSKPLNINTTTRQELEKIYFLTDFQIISLLDYRKKYGEMLSIYELPFVFGFDKEEAEKLAPYIYFGSSGSTKYYGNKNLFIVKSEYRPDNDKINNNIPIKLYTRYKFEGNKFNSGFTLENDPFEDLFKGPNKTGFDFYSGFAEYKPGSKYINKVIIGDYSASFGQALNLWGGYSTGKSVSSQQLRKRRQGFKPYTSANENQFMRGIAGSFNLSPVELNIFYSSKSIDANLFSDTTGYYFSSFQESGFHRTENEIEDEKSVSERIAGLNINYKSSWCNAGITYHTSQYSKPFQGNERIDKQFVSTGNLFELFSFDAEVFLKQTVLFGETAISGNRKTAWLAGIQVDLTYETRLAVLLRDYNEGYTCFNSAAFGENSENRNEKGFYIGLSNKFFNKLSISGYADFYKLPWLTYTVSAPSSGHEYCLNAEYRMGENVMLSLKYKTETKSKDYNTDENINTEIADYTRKSLRVQINYKVADNLYFKNRVETSSYKFVEGPEKGYVIYHDIKYMLPKPNLTIYGRYTLFDAQAFDTRIYQYENDLRYSFYVPFYYGKGVKYYLMCKYSINRDLDFYVKYERINYTDKNAENVIKGQVVWGF